MESLPTFLVFVVTSFLLFIVLYARYSKFDNELSRRQAEVAEKEEKIQLKVRAIDEELEFKRAEIAAVTERLDALRRELGI